MGELTPLKVIEKALIVLSVLACFIPTFLLSLLFLSSGSGPLEHSGVSDRTILLSLTSAASIAMLIATYQIVLLNKRIRDINIITIILIVIGAIAAIILAARLTPFFLVLIVIIAYVYFYAYRNGKIKA